MENTGISRKIDELGRIVLPIELRKILGWDIRDSILMSYDEENRTVILKLHKKYEGLKCVLCGKGESKVIIKGCDICADCLGMIKEIEST